MGTVGFFGVDLFFVLSAYLLTELMLREKESRGSLDILGFISVGCCGSGLSTFLRSPSRWFLAATGRS